MVKEKESDRSVALSSFRLPQPMVQRIDEMANRETRSRANMIQRLLMEALELRDKMEQTTKRK